ncbi:hypothetical protein ACFSQQ_06610 [Mesorhizobium kowhaii]|jgi:hypothetical protein|uniref:hypothetical protein n=1 Tax=Mesorhizobium kowhaii TaxID=1300272 RepID=UPI0035EC5614
MNQLMETAYQIFDPLLRYIREQQKNSDNREQWQKLSDRISELIYKYPGDREYESIGSNSIEIPEAHIGEIFGIYVQCAREFRKSSFGTDYISMAPLNDIFDVISSIR